MAKAYGYIIVYNNNGDIVYQHKGSGGDYGGTVSISNNIVTISSDYAPQVEPIDDSDPEFPDAFPTVIDTGEVNVSNLTNPTSLQIVLPYKASKIRYFSGNSGNFADSAGSDYADVIINNGETITLASNNYSSGGGCAIQYYEPQPTLAFKHFYDAGTIGTGAIKFRHYSQTEPLSQLATPQNVSANGSTVSWDAVENATSYEILVNDSGFGTVSTTSVDLSTLSGWASLTDGEYSVTIVAKADGYRDSEPSEAVSITKSSVKFVQIFPTTTPDNYTLIENLNQSKIYSIQSDIRTPDIIFYLKYENRKWKLWHYTSGGSLVDDSSYKIYSQTANSVKFMALDGSYFSNYTSGITIEGDIEATKADFAGFSPTTVYAYYVCFVEGTKITLSNGSTKLVQDIQYGDKVLCYDFTNGVQTTSYIDWKIPERIATKYWEITLSDGTILNLVGSNSKSHRLYNVTKQRFDYPQDFEADDLTLKEDGTTARVVSCKQIEKTVKFYNMASHEHINVYANGVLTSNRLNNKFKIVDNKFTDEKAMSDKEVADYIDYLNAIRAK